MPPAGIAWQVRVHGSCIVTRYIYSATIIATFDCVNGDRISILGFMIEEIYSHSVPISKDGPRICVGLVQTIAGYKGHSHGHRN